MMPFDRCQRSFLKTSVALAGAIPLMAGLLQTQSGEAAGPLIAYVGTFLPSVDMIELTRT